MRAEPRRNIGLGQTVRVRKLHWPGQHITWSWSGKVLAVDRRLVVLQAPFELPPGQAEVVVDGVSFTGADLSTEFYYWRRWYNVFQVVGSQGDEKGWYCNVAMPVRVDSEGLSYVDLFLDLFAHPDGSFTVLDQDEFAAAVPPDTPEARQARRSLDQLIALARRRALPTAFPSRPPG